MSTDTKLGMVLGLGVVIAVAVTYFPKQTAPKAGRTGSVMPSLPNATRTADLQAVSAEPRPPR